MDLHKHARLLVNSYRTWTGKELLDSEAPIAEGEECTRIMNANKVILSHGTEADPILNFGNPAALRLWEMTWEQFTRTPSRLTAEPMERSQRAVFMQTVTEQGYVDQYEGIRISRTGKRFYILQATVWNVLDERGLLIGQAATFTDYKFIDE